MTPKEVSKLRILDPACGSGSFLLGAYQYLLNWHLEWYIAHEPEEWAGKKKAPIYECFSRVPSPESRTPNWRLTTAERKRILLNNIYGVDIDPQAVEVTKLSLLLKVLEEENAETLERQLTLFRERALPDLAGNIKCGNSLIGPDFYEGRQRGLFDEEELYRVNAFDWNAEFPEIMKAGGFDAVIGNPPYVRSQTIESSARDFFRKSFRAATATYDVYVLFVEKGLSLLNGTGVLGFILPNKFFTTDYGQGLRQLLCETNTLEALVDFEDAQVFPGAGTYTTLLFLRKGVEAKPPSYVALGRIYENEKASGLARALSESDLDYEDLLLPDDGTRWTIATGSKGSLLLRCQEEYPPLRTSEPHLFQGLKTSADRIYMVRVMSRDASSSLVENMDHVQFHIENELLKPVVKGEHVHRYFTDLSRNLRVIYPYRITKGKVALIDVQELKDSFPLTWEYFLRYKQQLGKRDKGAWISRSDWYAYARSQNIGTFLGEKILVPYMTTRLRCNVDTEGNTFFVNITTGGYGLRFGDRNHSILYMLGILNSKLLNCFALMMTNRFRGGYFAINKQALERIPMRRICFNERRDIARHDQMVSLVQRMLDLHKSLQEASTDHEKTLLQRQISATDREIDQLVYELYDLTAEEIAIVEESTR